MVENNQYL